MAKLALALTFVALAMGACERSSKQATETAPPKINKSEPVVDLSTKPRVEGASEKSSATDKSQPDVTPTADTTKTTTVDTSMPGGGYDPGTASSTATLPSRSPSPSPSLSPSSTGTDPGRDKDKTSGSSTIEHQQRIGGWAGTSDRFPESSGYTAVDADTVSKGE